MGKSFSFIIICIGIARVIIMRWGIFVIVKKMVITDLGGFNDQNEGFFFFVILKMVISTISVTFHDHLLFLKMLRFT